MSYFFTLRRRLLVAYIFSSSEVLLLLEMRSNFEFGVVLRLLIEFSANKKLKLISDISNIFLNFITRTSIPS